MENLNLFDIYPDPAQTPAGSPADKRLTQADEPIKPGTLPTGFPLAERPADELKRGKCPVCGDDLYSMLFYIGGKGYILSWRCWRSMTAPATCDFEKVL